VLIQYRPFCSQSGRDQVGRVSIEVGEGDSRASVDSCRRRVVVAMVVVVVVVVAATLDDAGPPREAQCRATDNAVRRSANISRKSEATYNADGISCFDPWLLP
jgi:hypothetical protein